MFLSTDFKFKNDAPGLINTNFGQEKKIDCTTTDPNARTSLWFRSQSSPLFQQVKPNKDITQDGAVYTIISVAHSNVGQYNCRATNASGYTIKWPKSKGFLLNVGPGRNIIHVSVYFHFLSKGCMKAFQF